MKYYGLPIPQYQSHFIKDNHLFSRVHATLQPALSVGRSVGRLVSHTLLLLGFYFFDLTALAQMVW